MSSSRLAGFMQKLLLTLWVERDDRERKILAIIAVAAMLVLYYALLVAPALSGRAQLSKSLPELRQQVTQMQLLAKETAVVSVRPAAPAITLSGESIRAALARKSLAPQSVILSGNLVKVQLAAVSFAATVEWLDDMQKTARLALVDANIAALNRPDTVDATLTLRQF